jgi:hypothetical protein
MNYIPPLGKIFTSSHHALPGNDITATDLYSLQLHCTVPNEGLAEEAASLHWEFYAMGVNDEAIFSQQYFLLCCGPYLQLPELVEYFSAG